MPVYRHVHVSEYDGVTILRLVDREIRGEAAGEELQQELAQLAETAPPRDVVVDFGAVQHITSAALVQFIILNKQITGGGRRLMLCNLRPEVFDVFSVMRLDAMFDIEETPAAAIAALKTPLPPNEPPQPTNAEASGGKR